MKMTVLIYSRRNFFLGKQLNNFLSKKFFERQCFILKKEGNNKKDTFLWVDF